MNVAKQSDRDVCSVGEAHIGDVAFPQVYLCRAASSFNQHEVSLRA